MVAFSDGAFRSAKMLRENLLVLLSEQASTKSGTPILPFTSGTVVFRSSYDDSGQLVEALRASLDHLNDFSFFFCDCI